MVKTIQIGGGEVTLAANAATPYRFKQVFNEDLFQIFAATRNKTEEENASLTDTVAKLAFIMCKQAEKADMNMVSMVDFFDWLEGFGPMDLVFAGEEIMNFYNSSTKGSVEAKKK